METATDARRDVRQGHGGLKRPLIRPMATRACAWAPGFQQADGGISGGLDAAGNRLAWVSTEHHLDAYQQHFLDQVLMNRDPTGGIPYSLPDTIAA